jgi:3-oxoacyl-[acyl-carrier protein] reductase
VDLGVAGKSALVTGGTRGIGQAVAEALRAEGARVAIGYHTDAAGARALSGRLGGDAGGACALPYALEDPELAESAVAEVAGRWGSLDILVCSAVRRLPRGEAGARFEDAEPRRWEPVITGDLAATIRLCQAAVGHMRSRGWGRIVLLSSHVVRNGQPGQEFYAAGKAALHGLARSVAFDVGRDGIMINVVCPGLTATDGVLRMLPAELRNREAGRSATGRLSSPQDVASLVAFLCSAANGNITGSVLTVSGGR